MQSCDLDIKFLGLESTRVQFLKVMVLVLISRQMLGHVDYWHTGVWSTRTRSTRTHPSQGRSTRTLACKSTRFSAFKFRKHINDILHLIMHRGQLTPK